MHLLTSIFRRTLTEKDLIYFQRIFYFPEDMLRAWTKHPHRRWQVASVHFKTFNLQTVNLISRNDTLRKVKLSNFLLKNYLSPPFRNSAQLGKYKIQTINPSRPRIRGWRATGGWWQIKVAQFLPINSCLSSHHHHRKWNSKFALAAGTQQTAEIIGPEIRNPLQHRFS